MEKITMIQPIKSNITLKKKYIKDTKNQCYALKEYVEHPDLNLPLDKAKFVIQDLMNKTVAETSFSCIDTIATLNMIKDKHPNLEKYITPLVELLEEYNSTKIW